MFRITKAFQNESTDIFRIEGKITDENLSEWNQQISSIQPEIGRHVILDFAQVWYISAGAVAVLMNLLSDHVYILNCGIEVRNVLHSSGLSARMLE
jgi:anti-anti-sigma regulatory factor